MLIFQSTLFKQVIILFAYGCLYYLVTHFIDDELSNQAQLFAEENFTWTFPSQDLAWTVI